MSHLALTDSNGLYGLVWFLESARAHGLTPLVGAHLQSGGHRAVMLARNREGYRNLCRTLSSIHDKDDQSRDLFELLSRGNGNVLLSDDVGLLRRLIDAGMRENLYAELVPHAGREKVLNFARRHGLPVAASNAVYLVGKEDWRIHQLLCAIEQNTTLARIDPGILLSPEATLKSAEEMAAHFPDCPEALANTQSIARACTFNADASRFIFTSITGPNGESAQQLLEGQVWRGAEQRYGEISGEIRRRLEYELEIICQKGFAPYFLVVADVVQRAPRTCGRGSAAASVVSYCLGITHVDPVRYDLFFERFLNPGRVDPPDIDVDFPWDERDDILDYIFRTYGGNNTAMIANHNGFKARSAVREVAKVYGLPDSEISAVTKKMTGYWQPENLWDLTQTHPVYKKMTFPDPWPEIFELAERIRGYPRHLSVHCGGVVIAPDGLDRYVPCQPAKKVLMLTGEIGQPSGNGRIPGDRVRVVQWEKDQAEDMGLIKMDILGNRSLAVIRDALAAVRENSGEEIDYRLWNPLNDPDTIHLLERGETIGVFYVESPAMRLLQRKTGCGDFEHLVIHSSIIRPAANVYINEYIRRLKGGRYEPLHPKLEQLLKETYGIMVYQEDVAKVVMALAGFSASEADDLRKVISKKHKQIKVADYKKKFYLGAQANGVEPETRDRVWNMILSFSGYSFCKPHSASYAMVSFKSAYLRAHYPAEFMAAVISNQGGYYSTFAYLSEARRMGLRVEMPDINASEKQYTGRGESLRIGLMQLKGLSDRSLNAVLEERRSNGFFRSFDDFLSRVTISLADLIILIKAGCFDALEPGASRPELLWRVQRLRAERRSEQSSLFDGALHVSAALPAPPNYDEETLLRHEVEILGFVASRHPLDLYRSAIEKISYVPAAELGRHGNKRISTIGWFITGKTVSTRREELMEFMSFEDTTAIYETTFFPRAYAEFVHMLTRTRPFHLTGRVDVHYGAPTLTVERVRPL